MKNTVSGCPIEDAMQLLSGRWRTLLVYYLIDGKKRFAQLRRDNPKISHRMLTLELRVLEEAGVDRALRVGRSLRRSGRRVVFEPQPDRSLKAQMRRAHDLGAAFVLIIGASEIADGSVTVRKMADGTQERMAEGRVPERLREMAGA